MTQFTAAQECIYAPVRWLQTAAGRWQECGTAAFDV